jgi:hypothetical protein
LPHIACRAALSFAFLREVAVVQVIQLSAVVLGLGWLAAEIPLGGEKPIADSTGPQWRRTSEGWIKVGDTGSAALSRPNPQPASEPPLHPAVVAVFILFSGVLALSLFDQRPNRAANTSKPSVQAKRS